MQIRKPIRDYLDTPALLREVSMESLEAWASEVSYPAIIYRLMAMKVVQEEPKDDGKRIITNALAYSPNPNQLSKELYELALATETDDENVETHSESKEIENAGTDITQQLDISAPPEEETSEIAATPEVHPAGDSPADSVEHTDEGGVESEDEEHPLSDGLTSFSEWLLSLEQDDRRVDSDGENSEFASEALAGLLAKQGHIDKALQMYDQLALIYPEKSTYFAAQIQNLRGS